MRACDAGQAVRMMAYRPGKRAMAAALRKDPGPRWPMSAWMSHPGVSLALLRVDGALLEEQVAHVGGGRRGHDGSGAQPEKGGRGGPVSAGVNTKEYRSR